MSESLSVVVINIFDVLGGNWNPTDKKISFVQYTLHHRYYDNGLCAWHVDQVFKNCQFDS